jgi:hypothetical protein
MHRSAHKGIRLSSVAIVVALLAVGAWFNQPDDAINHATTAQTSKAQ